MNPELDQNLKEAEGTIQAMSKTYEILYSQKDLQTVNSKTYFESLISEMKRSFNMSQINIHLQTDAQLTMHQSIYLGIILNELITNALKYAFPDHKGDISINLKEEGSKKIFIFKDNGIGFDETTKGQDTFGLSFIEALVVDELEGDISIDGSDGVKIQIVF